MNTKTSILAIISVLFINFSCTNEYITKPEENCSTLSTNNSALDINGVNFENRNGILAFESREQIEKVTKGLSQISIPLTSSLLRSTYSGTNLTTVKILRDNGFQSLYDVYVDAMNNAEYYYEKPGGYEEFKSKYSTLYFPEEGDDYSAYLPISDKELAKIADINGNVIIGGETISLKDITSYEQLRELGQTPPSNALTLRATTGTNRISEEKNASGENKVWVNTSQSYYGAPINPILVVEVCFRKKGVLGIWYNHNSGTNAHLVSRFNLGMFEGSILESFGFSSHDYKYSIRHYANGTGVSTYPIEEDVEIYHNGTGKHLTLHVSRPSKPIIY